MLRGLVFVHAMLFSLFTMASAGAHFSDCTSSSGISGKGATYGASWGNLNGDGWADLWVSNHDRKPNLSLSSQRGSHR